MKERGSQATRVFYLYCLSTLPSVYVPGFNHRSTNLQQTTCTVSDIFDTTVVVNLWSTLVNNSGKEISSTIE